MLLFTLTQMSKGHLFQSLWQLHGKIEGLFVYVQVRNTSVTCPLILLHILHMSVYTSCCMFVCILRHYQCNVICDMSTLFDIHLF